jgi:diguanylate cyclase (GGDEF)-like protein/PAS domain S-box-containing protein
MGREVVLIVDDNVQIASFLAGTLLPSMGYETLVAHNGSTALKIIKEHERYLDLMLLDLQLPDTTGLDLLRKLGKDGIGIPTILVTAHGSEQVAADAFRLGVQDYLTKPFDNDLLKAAITRALTESRLRKEKATLTAQLQEQITWMTALSKVGRSLTASLNLDEVLRRIVEAAVHLTRAEEGFLALVDEESGQLYLRAAKNIEEDKISTMRLPITDSLIGSVLTSQKPVRAAQAALGAPLKVSTGYLVYSLLHVPLIFKGESRGALSVNNRGSKRMFKEKDEAVLLSLADYATIALENASLYQQAQQEIHERKRIETALRESEARYALAVNGANDGLWDWELKSNQIYFSPRWKTLLGYDNEGIPNHINEWFSRVHPDDLDNLKSRIAVHIKGLTAHFECEYRMAHRDGAYRWMHSRGIAVWDENRIATRMAGSQTDITSRKNAEQKLLHDAFHDSLTGLPNRSLFTDHLSQAIERTKRRKDYLYAVLFLDIDRFKDINDSLGHATGDQLLIAAGALLRNILRPVDTVARLGGDEFVILLEDISSIQDATMIADRIQEKFRSTSLVSGPTLYVTASIGIVLSLTGYDRAEDVLRDADIAMYRAKGNGKARYEIFDTAMRERIMERLTLETDLRLALEENQLVLNYQPIVSLKEGNLIGFEALVRWQHPRLGLLAPAKFIPLAEETGLVIPLDRWVLREACRQVYAWQQEYCFDPPLTVSVNLSARQVIQPDLVELVQQILLETGLSPENLHLEITESVTMEHVELIINVLNRLRDLGPKIQIDDFGIGYSSLNYLSQFPLNALKIDRFFVNMMLSDNNYMKIVQAIIRLTHGLGMGVIAEGVENPAQMDRLKELECEYVQGYYVSRPLVGERITPILARACKKGRTATIQDFTEEVI